MSSNDLCRLCFKSGTIGIFDDDGVALKVVELLNEHSKSLVIEGDVLPKFICDDCWEVFMDFHKFCESVKVAQQNYLTNAMKVETVEVDFVAPSDDLLPTDDILDAIKIENLQTCDEENTHTPDTQNGDDDLLEPMTKSLRSKRIPEPIETMKTITRNKDGTVRKKWTKRSPNELDKDMIELKTTKPIKRPCKPVLKKRLKRKKPETRKTKKPSKRKLKTAGEVAQERTQYKLSEEHEKIMLETFDMKCDLCSTQFKSFFDAKDHFIAAHQTKKGYLKCCYAKLRSQWEVEDHINYHIDPNQFKCKICNAQLRGKYWLQRHMKKHDRSIEFICDICGSKTWRRDHMKLHFYRFHLQPDPNLKCTICEKTFSHEILLHRHKMVIHRPNRKRVLCETCGRSFTEVTIIAHRKTHLSHDERIKNRKQCKLCGKVYLSRSGLMQHINGHRSGPQKCEICDLELISRDGLLTHIRQMHRERKFKCTICDRAYSMSSTLKNHMESHTRNKKYPCAYCPKVFEVQKSRHTHYTRTHTEAFKETVRLNELRRLGLLANEDDTAAVQKPTQILQA